VPARLPGLPKNICTAPEKWRKWLPFDPPDVALNQPRYTCDKKRTPLAKGRTAPRGPQWHNIVTHLPS